MNPQRKVFSDFIRRKMKEWKYKSKPNLITGNDNECNQIYNGCLTRFKLIEIRLNNVLNENALPCIEDIVEHLRSRPYEPDSFFDSQKPNGNENFISDLNFQSDFDLKVAIVSNKKENYNDAFPIKNAEFLLKEFLSLISQFIQIDDRSNNQPIIEKASVYLLWVFYDSFYLNKDDNVCDQQQQQSYNFNFEHYSSLEYIFCLESINFNLIEKMCFYSRSLFELMDVKYLNKIFFYPTIIKEAANDLEKQLCKDNCDWFKNFTEDYFHTQVLNEMINPFEIGELNYLLVTEDDQRLIKDAAKDLNKFNFDYSNAEFILQSLIYSDICPIQEDSFKILESSKNQIKSSATEKYDQSDALNNLSTEDVLSNLYTDLSSFIIDYNSKHDDVYYLNCEELYDAILNWLINSNDDKNLLEELTNLLGENSEQLIYKIITAYQPRIKSNMKPTNTSVTTNTNSTLNVVGAKNTKRVEQLWNKINKVRESGSNNVRSSIVVHTQKEKALKKEMRKIEKKYNKELNKVQKNILNENDQNEKLSLQDLEKMRDRNLKATVREVFKPILEEQFRRYKPVEKYPFVYDLYQTIRNSASYIAGTKLVLPIGTERKESKVYDQITIPIISSNEENQNFLKKNFTQIEIEDADQFIQIGFEGFSKLNIIQSAVFQTAYLSNQNMLICAPTGAGKTNIAMLTILNILRINSVDDSPKNISLDEFKIIYIAPMKALCAEMTSTFSKRLQPFGVKVRELTGDMQMTSKEIMETQMLIVTPEKWDVVTRKSVGDVQLMDLVRLIILDEVHLLQSDRGHVIETLVARTIRYVEQSQKIIRIIGLSATCPNYVDVARFLGVDLYKGLYVFDDRFRPVPLLKHFIGCKATTKNQRNQDMDEITMKKTIEILRKDAQVMIFVHSRNATMAMAEYILTKSQFNDNLNSDQDQNYLLFKQLFVADTEKLQNSSSLISRAKYRNLSKFLLNGIGIHHAGMPRGERNIVEKLFKYGVIKVLVCTSTLAWGVNLPAHSVIIRGTEYYDPSQGQFVDIDILDVMQIFGRAGRPQYDTDGEATIITEHGKLPNYLSLLTNQLPIESRFMKRLIDNLNAEIALGTVANIRETVEWLKYTYMYIRMQKNPIEYGLKSIASEEPSIILEHLTDLATRSAEHLDRACMIRYCPEAGGTLDSTHLGRIASHFYIQYETIVQLANELIAQSENDIGSILLLLADANEFKQLRCRDEEIVHLEKLRNKCQYQKITDVTEVKYKVFILMQTAISNEIISDCHSLNSDQTYILQNISRLTRGFFEFVLKKGLASLAQKLLNISLMFEKRIWCFDTPLKQFVSNTNELTCEILKKLSEMHIQRNIRHYDLKEMDPQEIGEYLRNKKYGSFVKKLAHYIPTVSIEASVKPITRTILTIYIDVEPDFQWDDKYHGKTAQIYWIWLADMNRNHIYHAELGHFNKKQVVRKESQRYIFTIPLLNAEDVQKQYLIQCSFEYWLGSEYETAVSCDNLVLPDKQLPNTPLLDLMPLPIKALGNDLFQSIYPFSHFNPIQTQIFHTLYHTDENVLLGAPTGSGKTIAAEIALFRVLNTNPNGKMVYIAPLKALVRERVDDWREKIEKKIGLKVVELTGDVTPDLATIDSSQLIVTTPEKWDGVSRGWTFRKFVRQVALIVIDEIHLLGEDRGPVLEMIVSRTNFICRRTGGKIRIVGLSTAVANAQDLSNWLNIQKIGLYNFSSSVRPVPIEVHVSGFSGKHYCPRMASMNKPAYRAIKQYSPTKPVIVFVSSRRQTRLTALDLITLIASDDHKSSMSFLHIDDEQEFETLLTTVKDGYLKNTLLFGIGMHHAGLIESDRKLVERLFSEQKIQVLITTATLAWGINLPAHAVIIKGTEFFDGKTSRYVDFPITDVLQMIGRAGRPQFDDSAVAILFVHDIKKEYYRKFLYEPFPVESHLLNVFPDHLNAEIVSGTVTTKHEAMEYLSSTYLYHRIIKNPSYYFEVEGSRHDELFINTQVIQFLSSYIDNCVKILLDNYCIQQYEDNGEDNELSNQVLLPTPLGKIASYYYLSYKTISMFQNKLGGESELKTSELLGLLTHATEYDTLPVRHNEELLNKQLSMSCPIKVDSMESAHTKANLLLQAHCGRIPLPIVDYYTDLKTVLDQVLRIMQAMIDVSAMNGSLPTTINTINLQQSIIQASWQNSNQLLVLLQADSNSDSFLEFNLSLDSKFSIPVLLNFIYKNRGENEFRRLFRNCSINHQLSNSTVSKIYKSLLNLPLIDFQKITIKKINQQQQQQHKDYFNVSFENTFKSVKDLDWIELESNTEYLICCQLKRISLTSNSSKSNKAFCPNFPKPKSESWYLVLGVQEDSELIALTRVPYINQFSTQVNIRFHTPKLSSNKRILYTLYLLSDCYIGLDQQYDIPLEVTFN